MSRLTDYLWRKIARFAARPAVADWLIERAMRTPYSHIGPADDRYMERFWLFNPYQLEGKKTWWRQWLPSVRVHHICRPDRDRHHHDHPWNARTIILKGWYVERRMHHQSHFGYDVGYEEKHHRLPGSTAAIRFGEYHTIDKLSHRAEVWTLFITWKYQGTWGFLVNGSKVPYKKYLNLEPVQKEENEEQT